MSVIIFTEEKFHQYLSLDLKGERVYKCNPGKSEYTISRYKPDIIILDCGFGAEGGLRLLRELKSRRPETPIIFITDGGSEDIVLRAFRAGARDFFKNPVNMYDLQETVKGILAVKKIAKETRNPFIKDSTFYTEKVADGGKSDAIHFHNPIHYIQQNLSSTMHLEDIARQAHVSKYHFCRTFKNHMGISPLKFVAQMRVEKAKELLKGNDVSISTVCADVGFSDLGSFNKQFKRLTGMTPSAYKKSLNSDGRKANYSL